MTRIEAFGVSGIGEVAAGADLAGLLVRALHATGDELRDGDLLVVSSKVVSKAAGRSVIATSRDAAVDAETVRVVAERSTPRGLTRVVQSRSGPVLAAAGVDNSNVPLGTVLLLPADPDASARELRHRLRELTGRRLGVLISDTLGRPWRDGQVDAAIGAAGVAVTDDLRGGQDGYGNGLEVTVRAVADELAGLADLVKGKLDGVPAAVVRGLAGLVLDADGAGASALLRAADEDWFRLGHVEAVRSALGVPPGTPGLPPAVLPPGGAVDRLTRAAAVALAAPSPWPEAGRLDVTVTAGPDRPELAVARVSGPSPAATEATLALGALVQRLLAAAWAEDLQARLCPGSDPDAGALIEARIRPRG